MIKLMCFIIISFLTSAPTFSQQWTENTSLPNNLSVCDSKFIDGNIGFVAMETGTGPHGLKVLKTVNKGSSWQEIWSGTSTNIEMQKMGIEFIDENTGFVFYDNKILKSNGGWHTVLTLPESNGQHYRIKFVNNTTGYALYSQGYYDFGITALSRIYKTVNGGDSWYQVNYQAPQYTDFIDLYDLDYSRQDPNVVFVCGTIRSHSTGNDGPIIWSAYDGFATQLNSYTVDPQYNVELVSYIAFLPNSYDDVIILCDRGVFKRSGNNFTQINPLIYSTYTPQAGLSLSTNNVGFAGTLNAVTQARFLYSTSDGGYTWNQEYSPGNLGISNIISYGDLAYKGGQNGSFFVRKIGMNLNTNFDWQGGTAGTLKIDDCRLTFAVCRLTSHFLLLPSAFCIYIYR